MKELQSEQLYGLPYDKALFLPYQKVPKVMTPSSYSKQVDLFLKILQ